MAAYGYFRFDISHPQFGKNEKFHGIQFEMYNHLLPTKEVSSFLLFLQLNRLEKRKP